MAGQYGGSIAIRQDGNDERDRGVAAGASSVGPGVVDGACAQNAALPSAPAAGADRGAATLARGCHDADHAGLDTGAVSGGE